MLRAWGKKNHFSILCHKQREKVTSGPHQMCMTGSSNNTQFQWNDSLSHELLLRTGPPSKSQDAQSLGQSYSKCSKEWRLHNFPGPCPSIWSLLSISLEFPPLQTVYITQDQHRPLHNSPDASGLPLLQCSCSKCRLKTQAWFWNYIIQEHRKGPAVQSATVVRKGWSSFKQLHLQQQQYWGF